MNKIIFFRRRGLGIGSIRGMHHYIETKNEENFIPKYKAGGTIGEKSGFVRNDFMHRFPKYDENDWLVRWGCTSRTENYKLERQLNTSKAIGQVNHKRNFRKLCSEEINEYTPPSIFNLGDAKIIMDFDEPFTDWIVRPSHHAQGKKLWVVSDYDELLTVIRNNNLGNKWYASKLIDKVSEYRVYVMEGRVITVARKIPDDPNQVAWNVAQGGEFQVCRWDDWPLKACTCAIEAFKLTDLDFGGVDVMIDKEGNPYIIEINSAPSLPPIHKEEGKIGKVSYRQKCMAKGFEWIVNNGKGSVKEYESGIGWRGYIHPAIWLPKEERE